MTASNPDKAVLVVTATAQDIGAWNALVSQSAEFEGYALVGGRENDLTLSLLEGVPMIIQNITFRQGDITPKGQDEPRDYVSLELMVSPEFRPRFPRGFIVINDGSTGIYRQIIKRLARDGRIDLPGGPEDGDANTTRYDISLTIDGEPFSFTGVNIYCPQGLRPSEYKNPDGSDSVTWYIA
jgi:hypothetical protein